jgi:hypothetical protein
MNLFKKPTILFQAFLQASGLVLYIILLTAFFNYVTPVFNNINAQYYAPIIMLLLFVFSAVISGLLVLGRAGYLFWEKKYKKSFILLGLTVFWIFFYFLLIICIILRK